MAESEPVVPEVHRYLDQDPPYTVDKAVVVRRPAVCYFPVHPDHPDPTAEEQALYEREAALIPEMRASLGLETPSSDQERFKQERSFVRFLRARKHKLPDAVQMYRDMLEWRKKEGVDAILDAPDPLEHVFQCVCPHRHHGWSKDGHPVYYEGDGEIRVAELLKHMEEKDIVWRHVRCMEYMIRRLDESSARHGRNVEKQVCVHDLAHLKYTIETAGIRCFRETTRIDQNYYPERLHKMFIINAPLSFRGVWAIVRPWLDPATAAKIEIIGSNYKEKLLEVIPKDQLPVRYGGECTCPECGDGCIPPVRPVGSAEIPGPWPLIE